jgi:phenylpropionate dioxygenase-like ring-hydroxylating dioxygenase large terminal subunit
MFVRNAWYVAALGRDVDRTPVKSRLLGDSLVLYRKRTGEVVALRDCCPHRHAPLSLGTLVGDEIQCRYHGFRFACDGSCTSIPGESVVPAAVSVQKFVATERHGFVWVWMGENAANEARLPEWPWLESPGFVSYHSQFTLDAPFEMIIDNLMDLTHVHFVHRLLGAGNLVHESEPMKTWEERDEVIFSRDLKGSETAADGTYVEIRGHYFSPSIVVTSGVPRREGSDELPPRPMSQVLHCLSPQNENSTHYFVLKCWNVLTKPHEIAAMNHQNEVTLSEDKEMIEAQFASKLADQSHATEKLIRADRAAVMARRVYERVLGREQRGGPDIRPGL